MADRTLIGVVRGKCRWLVLRFDYKFERDGVAGITIRVRFERAGLPPRGRLLPG